MQCYAVLAAMLTVAAICVGIHVYASEPCAHRSMSVRFSAGSACQGDRCPLDETVHARALNHADTGPGGDHAAGMELVAGPAISNPHFGHEWMGGAAAFAERSVAEKQRHKTAPKPGNATLLLIGVISGSKNFDTRDYLRRAFWRQRPWRLGIGWRFVVGTALPRGDNDRVSLHYESDYHRDIDFVRGSELPPRQGRVVIRWLVRVAELARTPGSPDFVAITYDSVLPSLPRLAIRLRILLQSQQIQSLLARQPFIYGGDLRWATWTEGHRGGSSWRCVKATTPSQMLEARLAGDSGVPDGELTPFARKRISALRPLMSSPGRRSACASRQSFGTAGIHTFLTPSPELQLFSASLLVSLAPPLAGRLGRHDLEVHPPAVLWEHSQAFHQSPAGRTPSQPALLASTAVARAVYNVSSSQASLTYVQLRTTPDAPVFSWEADPHSIPGKQSLLVRGVVNSIIAEAVVQRFERQNKSPITPHVQLRCAESNCWRWGFSKLEATSARCCMETQL